MQLKLFCNVLKYDNYASKIILNFFINLFEQWSVFVIYLLIIKWLVTWVVQVCLRLLFIITHYARKIFQIHIIAFNISTCIQQLILEALSWISDCVFSLLESALGGSCKFVVYKSSFMYLQCFKLLDFSLLRGLLTPI